MEQRLQTFLAHAGVASRRAAISVIENGQVTVDGVVVREKGHKVDPSKQKVCVKGVPVGHEKKYYFMLNKPVDVISTAIDTHGRKKVTDFFREIKARLYPVGRLDKDTTGLMVVTNDGPLANRLSHPSFGIEKEYLVTVGRKLGDNDIKRISSGIEVEGRKTAPCVIKTERTSGEGTVYRVYLHEGRKRQIREMFRQAGVRVQALDRVKYAGLSLGRLRRGEYRELTRAEIEMLSGKDTRG
ncbi:MAG: pseudouridine synthase [Candidatus Omnitrophica bacterium]|nr:pseudouridine synthase [Candidatus Omnitrophota bacterium]MDD5487444.1 pseudouridine synthase [Candidatus Omnitrophota bacterium]